MASHPPGRYGRAVIPLLIVALGAGLGVGGVLLLRQHTAGTLPGPRTATAGTQAALGAAGIYSRLAPSVVDVTATLRYDGETAAGTGFVVDARGALVITNNHVIRDATAVTARVASTGRTYQARIAGTDAGADIAVLKLQGATALTAAPLGDSAAVTVGTHVLAIGNKAGQDGPPTAVSGVVSGLNRTIQADDSGSGFTETLHGMLETSARIEPGDSGGPLAGPSGTVIGVDTAAAGHPVSSGDALTAIVNGCRPGTVVRVTWIGVAGVRRTSLVLLTAAPAV